MPIQIGAPREAGFDNPFGMLSDCHRRVERFLAVLVRVAEDSAGDALGEEEARALRAALVYFREAAPKHTADEEESVFPRLRALASAEAQQAVARAEALERDHRSAAVWHDTVDRLGQAWLDRGELSSDELTDLRSALRRLSQMYGDHITMEDKELFPLADKLLSPQEKLEIGREMARRRNVQKSE